MAARSNADDLVTKLPWEDLVFTHIFPFIEIVDLCKSREVCRSWKSCIETYFACMHKLDLTRYAYICNKEAFQVITRNTSQLQTLILRDCKDWLCDDILTPVCQRNRNLVHVCFANCNKNSLKVALHAMAVNNKEIEEVILKDCNWMQEDNVFMVASHCRKLKMFDLTGCWDITDDAVGLLTKFSTELEVLLLAKDYKLTDTSMKYIAANCKKIRRLNIKGCWRISDQGVRIVGEYCKTLKELMVKECRDVTEASLGRIRLRNIWVDKPKPMARVDPQEQD